MRAASVVLALRVLFPLARVAADNEAPGAVLQWYAPFLSGGGYCSEAISFAGALAQINSPLFSLHITQHGDSVNPTFSKSLPTKTQELFKSHWFTPPTASPPTIAICHSEPGAWNPPRYQTTLCPPKGTEYAIGRTMFETDRLPSGWAERMNDIMDEIWVPTTFAKTIFEAAGVPASKVTVVPEAVDVAFFNPDNVAPLPIDGVSSTTTVFLSIFKWEERKGWKTLLKAYFAEFSRTDDDVVLVLLTNAYHSSSDFASLVERFALDTFAGRSLEELPRIHILPPHLAQEDLPALYKAATAFVLPSRGEGWGRPHVEAMAMSLPVIATFWSGPTEYMTQENSYPLDIEGLVPVMPPSSWMMAKLDHTVGFVGRVGGIQRTSLGRAIRHTPSATHAACRPSS
ncbi:hypothetical protein, variant [Aphanomyces invadans]|uniref:Uncharacterized protein n=1 Tax=Aphanomyces invadans TaxID=157072 RepID=A0A024TYS7_9STRA|nr:hypothetical protein, variant [Aphanomyces invadans]ETV98482.1 hypothetical protein, variant [Aphanomyces invadans]|eukprot:XP_008872679.1 hypothetical protein, variant [Aphanomyces invadans]